MRLTYYAATPAAILLGAVSLHAQFTPVTAKIRITDETIRNGKVIKTKMREGNYYRSSDGSFIRQWTKIDGDEKAAPFSPGQLFDNRTATNYQLDFANHRAYEREKGGEPMVAHPPNYEAAKKLRHDSVQGIPCILNPVKFYHRDTNTYEDIGTNWRSLEYNLNLRLDLTRKLDNGDSVHEITELFEIHIGTEPDPKLFDLQKNFTVYRPEAAPH